ncbi:cytokine receptor-like isoform X1 [Camponotus floridanus]|uniref:cytokine receptor-like isoform X1 n=1 Tax=Camponotus floridanus TaxID=104421 RepID=UPI000DC6BC58|nr:cytokine receptor-like isoform X1 [Camponotus floridanus]
MSLNISIIRYSRRIPHLCISSIMKCYFNKIFHLSIAHRRDHSWGIRWISVVLNCLFLMINAQQVKANLPGLETSGWMVPEGDIIVKYGDNLQIWCNLNETFVDKNYPGANSWNIYFTNNYDRIEEKFITRINKTTALLNIESPPAGIFTYVCSLDLPNGVDVFVYLSEVFVAYEPQLPSNFTCRFYNWESITCKWNVSQHYTLTTHKLFYIVDTARRQEFVPCPIEEAKDYSCTWTQYTNPIYNQTQENYTFVMQIENMFDTKLFTYNTIDHFALVIPAKPTHLSVINKSSNSAKLCWQSPFSMNNFPPGLTHKVIYQNLWEKDWRVGTIYYINSDIFYLYRYNSSFIIINIDTEPHLHKRCSTLTGLYANTEYDAYVYLRSSKAVGEDMYSEPAAIIFSTLPTLPSFPPQTDIGSFEIVENNGIRDVYLYWQMIQEYHENGNKFKYWINHMEENDHKIVLEPNEMTKTYAKFNGLSFNKYRFKIVSQNEIGISKNYTEIIVPSQDKMPREPIEFTKMAFEKGLYELSWVPPIRHETITNYTIFWCDSKRDRPYQCTGYLNWTHVSMNTTVYNITVPNPNKIYQFAISANANEGSSGMVWSSCTVIRSKELGRMKFIWINRFGLDFIEVAWYFDCSDRIGVIKEIKTYYCPVVSVSSKFCTKSKRNISVKYHPYKSYGIVENLMRHTTYKLELAMVTKYDESQPSRALYQTTL